MNYVQQAAQANTFQQTLANPNVRTRSPRPARLPHGSHICQISQATAKQINNGLNMILVLHLTPIESTVPQCVGHTFEHVFFMQKVFQANILADFAKMVLGVEYLGQIIQQRPNIRPDEVAVIVSQRLGQCPHYLACNSVHKPSNKPNDPEPFVNVYIDMVYTQPFTLAAAQAEMQRRQAAAAVAPLPMAQPMQPAPQPAAPQAGFQPMAQPAPQPGFQPAPQQGFQPAPQAGFQPMTQPGAAPQPGFQPAPQAAPQPGFQPMTQPGAAPQPGAIQATGTILAGQPLPPVR